MHYRYVMISVYIYMCVYVYVYIYMYVCLSIYMYTYIYIYLCMISYDMILCEFLFYSILLWYYIFFATTISHHTVCNMPRGHWYKIYTWTFIYLVFALRSLIHQSFCVTAGGARPGQSFEEVNAHWASHDRWRRRWDWFIDNSWDRPDDEYFVWMSWNMWREFKNNISFSTSLALRLCLEGGVFATKNTTKKRGKAANDGDHRSLGSAFEKSSSQNLKRLAWSSSTYFPRVLHVDFMESIPSLKP